MANPNFDISGILAQGFQQQQPYLNQQYGWQTALPQIGSTVNDLVKAKMQQQAQAQYAQYLSLPPDQRSQPQNAIQGYKAQLALGYDPARELMYQARSVPKPVVTEDQKIKNIREESKARAEGTAAAGKTDKDTTEKFAQMLANGTPANQVSQALGRTGSKSLPDIWKRAFEINPNIKIDASNLTYQQKLQLMKTNLGPTIQLPARKIAAIIPRIDAAVNVSDSLPRTDLQAINKLGIAAAAQGGNRAAQRLLNQTKLVADEFQAQFGQGSDSKLDLAMSLLSSAQTVEQFRDAANDLKDAMNARREAILTGDVPKNPPQTQTTPTAAPQSLKPGTVQDGYRFKGGNPADQNSWEKL